MPDKLLFEEFCRLHRHDLSDEKGALELYTKWLERQLIVARVTICNLVD